MSSYTTSRNGKEEKGSPAAHTSLLLDAGGDVINPATGNTRLDNPETTDDDDDDDVGDDEGESNLDTLAVGDSFHQSAACGTKGPSNTANISRSVDFDLPDEEDDDEADRRSIRKEHVDEHGLVRKDKSVALNGPALLVPPRRTIPNDNILNPDPEPVDVAQEISDRPTAPFKSSRRKILFLGVGIVVVALVVISIVIGVKVGSRNRSRGPVTSQRFQAIRSLLLSNSFSAAALNNPLSPQYRALSWIANEDQANVDVAAPDVTTIINRYVLAVLYFQNNGKNWVNQCKFLSAGNVCEWRNKQGTGVNCSSPGVLLELVLQRNGLAGTIPMELGMLSTLTNLDLSENNLAGQVPTSLGKLSSVSFLNLGANQITGKVPAEIGSMSSLTKLLLGSNQFTGMIPAELGGLSLVTYVDLSLNQLFGSIPVDVAKLSNLTYLDLGQNQLAGIIPAELGSLSMLTDLGLSGNQITGKIPTEIGKLSNLTGLRLGYNLISGMIPTELGKCSSLSYLSLRYNSLLNGTIPVALGALSNLNTLYLQGTSVSGNLTAVFCTGSQSWEYLAADCVKEVVCSCCTTCL